VRRVATRLRASIKIADAGSSPIRNHVARGGAPGSGTIPPAEGDRKAVRSWLASGYAPAAGTSCRRPRPPYPLASGGVWACGARAEFWAFAFWRFCDEDHG
jgi:hypothetical protein